VSYYHLGLPSFALDFWTLPEVKEEKKDGALTSEQLEKMSKDEFLGFGRREDRRLPQGRRRPTSSRPSR